MGKTSYERLAFQVAVSVSNSLHGVEPEDLLSSIYLVLPQTQAQALEDDEAFRTQMQAADLGAGRLRDPRNSPLGKLRTALHADKLTIACVLNAATEKVTEAAKEKARRGYYQNIVYSVCKSLDALCGTAVVCGTVDDPSTQVQDAMANFVKAVKEA